MSETARDSPGQSHRQRPCELWDMGSGQHSGAGLTVRSSMEHLLGIYWGDKLLGPTADLPRQAEPVHVCRGVPLHSCSFGALWVRAGHARKPLGLKGGTPLWESPPWEECHHSSQCRYTPLLCGAPVRFQSQLALLVSGSRASPHKVVPLPDFSTLVSQKLGGESG